MNTRTKNEIEKIKEKVNPILKKYGAVRAGLFGSFVRGEMKKDSDIDILVKFPRKKRISLLKFIHIRNEIADTLHKEIDLVEYPAIKPALKEIILNEEVKIL